MKINSYKNLIVWQRSMELADEIYKLTGKFPDDEKYSLVSQMRRCAISIPSNIAEGYRRNSKGSYVQFLSISYGSGGELETQIEICKRNLKLNMSEYKKVENLLEEVMKMLNKLISSLRTTAYDLRTNQGFTLVELLIAMTLFIAVIGISAGSFVQILRTQRMTVALIAANNNAVLTLEQITREIRTGLNFSTKANGDTNDLLFTNAQSQSVTYHWDSAAQALEKSIDGVNFKKLTADNVLVSRASFDLFKDPGGNQFPPRITMALAVGATGLPFTAPTINLEMTVSSRVLQ